jgi:predicted secreted protein/N-acetylneuraminic acid mutarotase
MKKTISIVLVLGMVSIGLAAEDTWTRKTDMPTARSCHSTSVVNGKIYAIGGMRNASSAPLSVVEEYDPETDTWTTKSNMPTAKISHGACAVEGKIYVIGGGQRVLGSGSSTVQQYDPETDTWTRKANMPTARFVLSASAVNGKIYAIGGKPAHGVSPLKTVEEYDPTTDTWITKAGMLTARYGLCTCAVNGRVYAIGGDPGSYVGLRTVEEYDPITDTWTTKADMLSARAFLSVSALGGRIYAIGGVPSLTGAPLSIVDEYDPSTNTWIRKSDMPTPILLLSSSTVNSQIYVVGGADKPYPSWQACSTVEEYDPNPLVVDFNGDGIVDSVDMCMMIDYWGTDEPLYDIAPPPFGDGIVDVEDLKILAEHLFEVYPSAETVDVTEADNGRQIEVELGKLLAVTLESNPSTGYQWELVENNDSVLKQFGQVEYKPAETSEQPIVGVGGWEIFRFKATSAGQSTLELVYHRPWEDAEPLETFSIQVTVP